MKTVTEDTRLHSGSAGDTNESPYLPVFSPFKVAESRFAWLAPTHAVHAGIGGSLPGDAQRSCRDKTGHSSTVSDKFSASDEQTRVTDEQTRVTER